MQRIGLFGGSFDPVHLGHLLVAQAAREELGLTRIFFIPTHRSPFKPDASPLGGGERLRLLRLALAGQSHVQVDDQEVKRAGVSYTIDTVRDYSGRFPGAKLFCLVGADQVPQLEKWRDAAELARLVEFAIIPRPGEGEVVCPPPFAGRMLKGFSLALSSSQVRARLRAGQSITHLVPAAVAEAIQNNHLYL